MANDIIGAAQLAKVTGEVAGGVASAPGTGGASIVIAAKGSVSLKKAVEKIDLARKYIKKAENAYKQYCIDDQKYDQIGEAIFYTVQNDADTQRLFGDGLPWPTEPHRANLGDGVYAWGSLSEAERYMEIKQRRTSEHLQILKFSIDKKDLSQMNTLDLRMLSDEEVNLFLDTYARLNGGVPNHGYDYIIRETTLGAENYLHKDVFDKLNFTK